MRKGVWHGLLTGLALLLAACGGGGQPQPDLTLAGISPQNPTVVQGQTLTLTLTFTSQNGFQGQVSLSVTDRQTGQPPSWLTLSPTSATLNVPKGGQDQVSLQVQVAANAPTGPHALKLRASYGDKVAERDLTLTVNAPPPPPSFTLSDPTPNPLSVQAGGTATFQVTLTSQNGFQGQVTLSLADGQNPLPQGLAISATNPSPINLQAGGSVTVTATVSADAQVAPGIYRLKVRATSGSLIREANLTVGVWTDYTNAYVYQVSGDGSVLVGSASMLGVLRPMTWQINAASLSQGFYWLSAVAQQTFVLDMGISSYGGMFGVTADGQVGCGYGSGNDPSQQKALAWDLTTLQLIPLPGFANGGNVAYACAKRGSDVYIVGRIIPSFPTPTIWRNYIIWHQNTSVAYGIFHDITPDASKASAQLLYEGWVYDLNSNQYTQLVPSIGGAYWSRISPDGQAVAFSDSNSSARAKVWYGGNVYSVNMGLGAVRVRNGVAYVFGGSPDGLAVRWRSDTQVLEDLNTVFADVLPPGVTLKGISAVSLDNRVIVGIAYNPTTSQDEPFVLVGDPFQGAP
ncbi:MAG: putative Ig domain-containing protein [Thermus sp.]|nr:putative Ig domain-containing protein [Thermus sp.]